ncbi:MAG: glycosyltransferase family 39 protein [Opitutae bacterium]|nr:glycosyltransferase family 39 protein [Opitutae bacterium]
MIAPDATASLGAWLLVGPAAGFGFFLSGYFAFRWLPSPQKLATSFVGSGLLLFFAVLAGDFFQVALTREYLTVMLGAAALAGWLLSRCKRGTDDRLRASVAWVRPGQWYREAWWLVPGLIATTSLLAHLVLEPLSGFDTLFRWDYLARVMASQQSLQHYPPVTAEDFAVYPWCDGIPPLVSIMSLWLYLSTGSSAELVGSVRTAVEFGLTVALVWQISRRLWGATGARVSILVLSTSSLFLSSISMGQETGLSGIALLTLTALLLDYRETPRAATAAWIGLAAGFGGLCRDYNLIFLPVTLGLLAFARPHRAHWWLAAATMAATVAPWYLRNAWITGNPLFPHALGGLLPSNHAHQQVMREIQDFWSLFANYWNPIGLLKSVLLGAGALIPAALLGLKPDRFERIVPAGLILTTVALWLASISSTAGGWTYSLRVLGSALPLLAIVAAASVQVLKGRWAFAGAILCALLTVDAARRSWIFVITPTAPVLPYTWHPWEKWARFIRWDRDPAVWESLSAAAQGESIVVDHPNFFVLGRRNGGNMVSTFSPQLAVLWRYSPPMGLADLRQTLREQHIRFVVLSGGTNAEMYFYKSAPGIVRLLATKPTVTTRGLWIYDLALPEQTPPTR